MSHEDQEPVDMPDDAYFGIPIGNRTWFTITTYAGAVYPNNSTDSAGSAEEQVVRIRRHWDLSRVHERDKAAEITIQPDGEIVSGGKPISLGDFVMPKIDGATPLNVDSVVQEPNVTWGGEGLIKITIEGAPEPSLDGVYTTTAERIAELAVDREHGDPTREVTHDSNARLRIDALLTSMEPLAVPAAVRVHAGEVLGLALAWRVAYIEASSLKQAGDEEGYYAKCRAIEVLHGRMSQKLDSMIGDDDNVKPEAGLSASEVTAALEAGEVVEEVVAPEVEKRQRFIVGEATITYDKSEDVEAVRARVEDSMGTISKRFEHVVDVNAERGYRLMNWHMTSVPIIGQTGALMPTTSITETIVGVFEDERAIQKRMWGQ